MSSLEQDKLEADGREKIVRGEHAVTGWRGARNYRREGKREG